MTEHTGHWPCCTLCLKYFLQIFLGYLHCFHTFTEKMLLHILFTPHLSEWVLTKNNNNNSSPNNRYWQECGEKEILVYCWWEGRLVQPLQSIAWRFLRQWKLEWPYNPANGYSSTILSAYLRILKHQFEKDIYSYVHSTIIYNNQYMKAT